MMILIFFKSLLKCLRNTKGLAFIKQRCDYLNIKCGFYDAMLENCARPSGVVCQKRGRIWMGHKRDTSVPHLCLKRNSNNGSLSKEA